MHRDTTPKVAVSPDKVIGADPAPPEKPVILFVLIVLAIVFYCCISKRKNLRYALEVDSKRT